MQLLHKQSHLDDVGAVVVEIPQLAVVLLVRPPEGVHPRDLVLLELLPHPPPAVVRQRVAAGEEAKQRNGNQTLYFSCIHDTGGHDHASIENNATNCDAKAQFDTGHNQ